MEKKTMFLAIAAVAVIIVAGVGAALLLGGSGSEDTNAKIVLLQKTSSSPAYSPLDKTAVYNGSYPLSRYLYLYTDGVPDHASSVYKWLSYVLNSSTGQVLVDDAGFYPLQPSDLNAMKAQLAVSNTTGPTGDFKEGGSTTMAELSNLWSYDFKNATGITVTISLGGSGTGIANFINGVVDVAQSSRAMTATERTQAAAAHLNVTEWKVAVDGISIIVNHDNPVKVLTLAQLEGIYNGTYTNWNQVGGNNQAITLYGRDGASGTYASFKDLVLKHKDNYSQAMLQFNSNALIVPEVQNNAGGVGYVGIGYAKEASGTPATSGLMEFAGLIGLSNRW
ncbi:MAG TPA: substrate-binding domain-containing protein [Methanomassiliicoccales archaeon]|nr:substrate-binding domain-containing protein [Methanomassiliicoccales archaeon]